MTTLAPTPGVAEVLEKALDGERISDDEAVTLLAQNKASGTGSAESAGSTRGSIGPD